MSQNKFVHMIGIGGIGMSVLFRPAFASFGMLKNEYDLGEQFIKLVGE